MSATDSSTIRSPGRVRRPPRSERVGVGLRDDFRNALAAPRIAPGEIAHGGILLKIRQHVFEFCTSTAYLLIGLNYLLDHSAGRRSAIGHTVHPWDYWWSSLYIASAFFIWYGLLRVRQSWRVAGLIFLTSALLMNFIASVATPPLEPRDFVTLIFAASCLVRALLGAETVKPVFTKRFKQNGVEKSVRD